MSSHDLQISRRIWTEYWRGNRQGCLTDEAPASAREHIINLWRGWFRLRPSGSRILDLACGAGDVARIALSVSGEAELHFNIEGVDLADLDPALQTTTTAKSATMRLQGGIDLGRLPFPDKSFDCAVSQFGIEYTDLGAACHELARVMKDESSGLFLLHHRKSAISAAAASRMEAFAAVIGDGEILDRATQLYDSILRHAAEPVIATRLAQFRQSLRTAFAAHSSGFSWESNLREILGFLSDLARNPGIYDPADALRRLDVARQMIAAWTSRQHSELAAARDESGMQELGETLRSVGFTPDDFGVVNDPASGAILAWKLRFSAPQLP